MGETSEKKKQKDEVEKPTLCEQFIRIIDAINRRPMAQLFRMPKFPEMFHTVEPEKGRRLILHERDGEVVSYVSRDAVAIAISNYIRAPELWVQGSYKFDWRKARECSDLWVAQTAPIEEPAMVLFADEPGKTFRRLPWSSEVSGDYGSAFKEMLSRTTNASALMAAIGSLFFAQADRQQYVWVYGEGQNGKSALSRFLGSVLGEAHVSLIPPFPGQERFFTSQLIGKRLAIFPDCEHRSFPTRGLFKMLTGNDAVPIEPKGQSSYTARLSIKFLFISNCLPSITSEVSDTRRAIFCEMAPIKGEPDPFYDAKLWEEGGKFLSACKKAYLDACPFHGPIPSESVDLSDVIDTNEEHLQVAFEENFELNPDGWVTAAGMQSFLKANFKHPYEQTEFRGWLKRKHGIKSRPKKTDGRVDKVYLGISRIVGSGLNERW